MSQRFGQASDYGPQLAYLARQNDIRMQDAAQRIDRQREEELAAKDAEMFTRYQEGKLSGREILEYIRQRVRQTGYDEAQQRKWKATLVEYENAVADEYATAEYERTGNIHAYIQHWVGRARGTKRGSPEYTQIQSMLSDLREQRDQKAIRREADRIMREIQKGKKSTKDLIDFYRDALGRKGLSEDLRSQIKDTIAQLRSQWQQEQYTIAQLKVDEKLAAGRITPQEAARMKEENAQQWNLMTWNAVGYQELQGEIRVLNATPDPAEVAKAQADLIAGNITETEFADKMSDWADMIEPFDRQAAWELRGSAREIRKEYQEAQALANPGVLGIQGSTGGQKAVRVINNFIGKRLNHITQMDGSQYQYLNCTMAAAAMMGHTMGTKGLTGADLRAKTGDTSGGTTLIQAKYALERSGVKHLRYKNDMDFDRFKQNVKQGSTAMVSGYLGVLSDKTGFNNAGLNANHTVYVARYDPQKGFLILDPAINRRGYKGEWFSEDVIRKFAWTGFGHGSASRNGSVMMAPRGTLKTRWNKGRSWDPRKTKKTTSKQAEAEKAKAGSTAGFTDYVDIEEGLAFISADAPAQTEEGKVYEGINNPGFDFAEAATKAMNEDWDTEAHRNRLRAAGIEPNDPDLQTKDEVIERANLQTESVSNLRGWIAGFAEVYQGGEGAYQVTNGSQTMTLTRADVSKLEKELVLALDGLYLLHKAIGNDEGADMARRAINETILISQNVTATDMGWERARLFDSVAKRLSDAKGVEDTKRALSESISDIQQFGEQWTEEEEYGPYAPGEEPTEQTQALDELGQLPESIPVGEPDTESTARPNDIIIGDFAQDLAQLATVLENPQALPEDIYGLVLGFADTYNIEMPDGWPEPLEEGTEVGGMAASLMQLAGTAVVVGQLAREEGEMVVIGGEEAFVPYVATGGQTTSGGRAEGIGTATVGELAEAGAEVPEDVDPATGIAFGTGSVGVLDIDYITETLGVELPEHFQLYGSGLPRAFVNIDGEAKSVAVVPEQIEYEGADMLRIEDLEKVKAFFSSRQLIMPDGLEEGDIIGADQLSRFPPYVVSQLLQNEALAKEPYLVWTMQLPGQEHPWFMDPETELWAYNGLPHVGRGQDMPGVKEGPQALRYIGGRYDEATGRPVPEPVNSSEAGADVTTWVATPFGADIMPQVAADLQMNGEGNIHSGFVRDHIDGQIRPAEPNEMGMDQYVNITAASDAATRAIHESRLMAERAWETLKGEPPEVREKLGSVTDFDPSLGLGEFAPETATNDPAKLLEIIGATDQASEIRKNRQQGFTPPPLKNLWNLDIQSSIGRATQAFESSLGKLKGWQPPTDTVDPIKWKPLPMQPGTEYDPSPVEYTPPEPDRSYDPLSSATTGR